MASVFCAKYLPPRYWEIPFVALFDPYHCENLVACVQQRDLAIQGNGFVIGDWQRDRDWKQLAGGKSHFLKDARVIRGTHKTVEGMESPGSEHFEVANCPFGKFNRGKFFGSGQSFSEIGKHGFSRLTQANVIYLSKICVESQGSFETTVSRLTKRCWPA